MGRITQWQKKPNGFIPLSLPTGLRRPGEHSGGGVGRASGLEAGLDVPQLLRTVEELFREGLAPTTRRTYVTGKRRYLRFCESLGLSPTPASEQVLQVFVASLARDGLAHSTVKNYLAAVRYFHLEEGLPDPKVVDMARLQLVVRGVKKEQARASAPRTRLPKVNWPEVLCISECVNCLCG